MQLLLCAGNVEADLEPDNVGTNPCPDDRLDQILKELQDVIVSNITHRNETSVKLDQINLGVNDISQRVSKLEEKFCEVT